MERGIPTVLFGNYPWNQNLDKIDVDHLTYDSHPNDIEVLTYVHRDDPPILSNNTIIRALDWQSVTKFILSKFKISNKIKVAAIQMSSMNNKLTNLLATHRLIHKAIFERYVT